MHRPRAGANRPLRARGEEGGFVIVLSLLVLFALTLLGIASIMSSSIEAKISTNENFANQALYAADAGLAHALTALNDGTIPGLPNDEEDPFYDNPIWSWPADSDSDLATKSEASGDYVVQALRTPADPSVVGTVPATLRYRWYMNFKKDLEDLDGDGDTAEYVLYNQHFHYPQSQFSADGYPVIEVVSEGYVRGYTVSAAGAVISVEDKAERRLALELGRNTFDVTVEGALTARSNVELSGNITLDGRNHDLYGNLGGSCGSDMPDVFVDVGKTVTAGVAARDEDNNPIVGTVNDGSKDIKRTPWGVLGIGQETVDPPQTSPPVAFLNQFTKTVLATNTYDLPLSGNHWVTGVRADGAPIANMNVHFNGTAGGILIVHNEHFHPDVWEVSNPASPAYDTSSSKYHAEADSSQAAFDPSWAPAQFTLQSNDTFIGVIIADTVIKLSGSPTIIGAIISLSTLGVQNTGAGNPRVVYSCEAIQQATTQGYATKLLWRKL